MSAVARRCFAPCALSQAGEPCACTRGPLTCCAEGEVTDGEHHESHCTALADLDALHAKDVNDPKEEA